MKRALIFPDLIFSNKSTALIPFPLKPAFTSLAPLVFGARSATPRKLSL